jgi:putative transposase
MRWARRRVWEGIFDDLVKDKKNQYLMIDSTIVRAHQQAATGRKKGASKTRLWGVPEGV